ncbi:kinase-like domain-containing protein [Favolaschia claudopus]|uniref:Kinase-like domain-containing protein n=1 Tax=Favolaschia claudopus TaxID=2862362 RepID=A0AAW0A6K4_9AGAR
MSNVATASSSSAAQFWGYLEPLVPSLNVQRINFVKHSVAIGRAAANDVLFDGCAVSKLHATIQWNGRRDRMSVVTITNLSATNGTFVDGAKVEGINVHRLFDGCTVFFGCRVRVQGEEDDYRFTFRHPFGRSKNETVFNHYTVGDRIGGGLHGHVHRALEKATGKIFAVKTSWRHDRPESLACAVQEAVAFMNLAHDNIARLHEVFFRMDNGTLDMVLEYIDGISLEALVLQSRLSELQAKELTLQLSRGVAFLHEKKISHGDLKLDNVLLTRHPPPQVKIIDFGLAKVDRLWSTHPVLTDHIFTAPEAHQQAIMNTITHYTVCQQWDGWALGCIVFHLCVRFCLTFRLGASSGKPSLRGDLSERQGRE